MVKLNPKPREVLLVSRLHLSYQLLLAPAFLPCSYHDCSAMRVIGTYKNTFATYQLLKPYPNVSLDVFDHVTNVNVTVGIRQSSSNQ
jgi:hypothetical protein